MGIHRRGFIKFAVGAVVGLQVTPIPWKLTGDIAIWTQNWPWVPDPKNGEISYRYISGGLNNCGCGLRVRLVDKKRAVSISGNPDHPLSQGAVCPMCAASLQYFYNQQLRLTTPMKNVGGDWLKVTWDEAMKTMAAKLTDIRKAGAPQKIAMINDGANSATTSILNRFMQAYGSPNVYSMPSMRDTNRVVAKAMFGVDGDLGYDLHNSDYILSFGSGIVEGWGQNVFTMNAYQHIATNPKAKLVQVETNLSATGSKASRWVAVNPGTEGALALGIAHIILKENLFKPENVSSLYGFGSGPSSFRDMVLANYVPTKVTAITGVPEAVITEIAREFAKAQNPVAVAGRGKGTMPGDVQEFMAIMSLNAVVGSVGRKGGVGPVAVPVSPLGDVAPDTTASAGLNGKPFGGGTLTGFVQEVAAQEKVPFDMLIVDGSNPAYEMPGALDFKEVRKKIPFIVCVAPFYNETVAMADLVLPSATFLEKWDDLAGASTVPFPVYQVTIPTFHPIYDSKATGEIFLAQAKSLGGSVADAMPWKSMEQVVMARGKGVFQSGTGMVAEPGSMGKSGKGFGSENDFWKGVASSGCWYDPAAAVGTAPLTAQTPSGSVELASQSVQGVAAAAYKPAAAPGDANAYPLLLMPYETMWISGDGLASAPYLTKLFPDTLLRGKDLFAGVNPQTASKLNVSEGDWIQVASSKGALKVRAHLANGVRPDVIAMAEGFGHTAFDAHMKDKGVNVREIVTVQTDKSSGLPQWWGTRVKVTKV